MFQLIIINVTQRDLTPFVSILSILQSENSFVRYVSCLEGNTYGNPIK